MKSLNKKTIKKGLKSNYVKLLMQILGIALFTLVAGEMIIRQDINRVLDWINDYTVAFVLNLGLIMTCIFILVHIFNSLRISSFITIGCYSILCVVNYFKFDIKGEYLSPLDFNLIGETLNIVTNFKLRFTVTLIMVIAIIVGICLYIYKMKFQKIKWQIRVIGVLIGVVVLASIINLFMDNQTLEKIKIQNDIYFVNNNYSNHGLLLTLVNCTNEMKVNKPENYNKETVAQLLGNESATGEKAVKPNIIMVMSEAFFDINKLPNINLSENPLENFYRYQAEGIKGNIITPIFGGYTSQTEYEVLTGNSTDFTGTGNIAYTRYVTQNTPSMAKQLKNMGYHTVGIHPYERTFYRRNAVYEQLGFDEFITQEQFENPNYIRGYISDQDVFERIVAEYEKNRDNPFFTYVVTMQNHGPYTGVNRDADVELLNNTLPEEDTNILTNYASIVKESDQALTYLVEYFRNVEEPTIIVLFGDHQPVLGNAYSNTGYLDENYLINAFKQHQTPLMIWSNYNNDQRDIGYIDASYLGAVTLEYAGLNIDNYFKVLLEKANDIRAYNTGFSIDRNEKIISNDQLDNTAIRALKDLWILQYDVMFGKNYSER